MKAVVRSATRVLIVLEFLDDTRVEWVSSITDFIRSAHLTHAVLAVTLAVFSYDIVIVLLLFNRNFCFRVKEL